MNSPTTKERPRKCVYCGEIAILVKDYPHEKAKKPVVHDSCKPFYILLKKLRP